MWGARASPATQAPAARPCVDEQQAPRPRSRQTQQPLHDTGREEYPCRARGAELCIASGERGRRLASAWPRAGTPSEARSPVSSEGFQPTLSNTNTSSPSGDWTFQRPHFALASSTATRTMHGGAGGGLWRAPQRDHAAVLPPPSFSQITQCPHQALPGPTEPAVLGSPIHPSPPWRAAPPPRGCRGAALRASGAGPQIGQPPPARGPRDARLRRRDDWSVPRSAAANTAADAPCARARNGRQQQRGGEEVRVATYAPIHCGCGRAPPV